MTLLTSISFSGLAKVDYAELAAKLQATARRFRTSTRSRIELKKRVLQLEEEVASLALLSRTLLQVLFDKKICSPEAFQDTFQTHDLEDGELDGK